MPLLGDKKATYLTHGSPRLPLLTLYVNSVRLRLEMVFILLYSVGLRLKPLNLECTIYLK